MTRLKQQDNKVVQLHSKDAQMLQILTDDIK